MFPNPASVLTLTAVYYVGINAAGSQLEFGWASNAWHSIANVPMPIDANTFYHLKVQALGSHIRIFVTDMNQAVIDINDDIFRRA